MTSYELRDREHRKLAIGRLGSNGTFAWPVILNLEIPMPSASRSSARG
jgi:hypothetical protein